MNVARYVYIGQNIREYGILKQDSYLKQMTSVVQSLSSKGIIEEERWYKFDVLRVSYRFMVPLKEIFEKDLQSKKEELRSALQSIPKTLLSFYVYEYLTEDISFPVKEPDWLFDWRYVLLQNKTVSKYKRAFFKILIDFGLCVKTHSYVSTKGGELRDEEYVITSEIKRTLDEITPHLQFPNPLKDLAMIHSLISEEIEYEKRKIVEVTLTDETLAELGSGLDTTRDVFDALLVRLNSATVLEETRRTPGFGWELMANKKALLSFMTMDLQDQIVKPLLSEKARVFEEESKEKTDFLKLVRQLIDKKFSVYKVAAQFGGKEIFKSLPYIERCVVDLTTPLPREEGLRKFVGDLHQVLEESSTKEILKFREGDYTSLEAWLEIEIPQEISSSYEDTKSFFRDLNRLRNFYSHSVDAKGIFESGLIFSKLIGKYSPEKDDITKTQTILLERSIRALDGLIRTLEMAWQKRLSS